MNAQRKLSVCLLICMLIMLCSEALAASGQYEVTAGRLNFREEASADSRTITALSEGTTVTVLSASGGWAKARWNGKVGYLSTEYLDKITSASRDGKNTTKLSGEAWLKKNSALYEEADTSSEEVAELAKGEKLSLRGETMKFYYVKADGKTGYVLKSRVTTEEQESGESVGEKSSSGSGSASSGVLRRGAKGDAVEELQERLSTLGYLNERYITGYFGSLTEDAVTLFQASAGLDADGVVGPATSKKLNSSSAPKQKQVVEMDWYESNVSSLVKKRGGTAYIIDVRTGVRIKIRRVGGSNHMDVEPATAEDTEKLLELYGGSWSWDQRAVVLVAGGKYIAASINGMPHGDEISTTNNYDGQFCLHTTNSRTHGTDKVNARHQECIEEALDAF